MHLREDAGTATTYTLSDGASEEEIEAADRDDARKQAEEWARGGDWGVEEDQRYVYVDVRIYEVGEGEDGEHIEELVDTVTVAIAPEEPDCTHEDGHDWQAPHEIVGGIESNPGVWGHGGGIIADECCMRCGCRRRTDTWAQRSDTGEQGLEEVTYQPGYYAEQISRLEADKE